MTLTRDLVGVLTVLLILAVDGSFTLGRPQHIVPGCRYEGRRYHEGTVVNTSEPCLRCRCIEGALRCRLRVCPRLPNPPPTGCRIRPPGENVCCAELICGESRDIENMLRRANVEGENNLGEQSDEYRSRSEGCLHEGVRYGPGSAMMGSRRCEYCFCISGARRCVRPKCLLPLPGCSPLYAPHSCCPVAYNCSQNIHSSTVAPVIRNGCRVNERTYEEGEMVRDIAWKAACDNCFCAMAAVRCVPLSCAPPLQGCSPIVREGQCCPSTYNCSGSIEVKATQNYASYAFISKDYAKFRKETNFFPAVEHTTTLPVEGRGHRVVDERIDSSTIDVEQESSVLPTDSTSWPSTFETDIMENEILTETKARTKFTLEFTTGTSVATTVEESTIDASTTFSNTTSTRNVEDATDPSTLMATSTSAFTESTITTADDPSTTEEESSSSFLESIPVTLETSTSRANVSPNESTSNQEETVVATEKNSTTLATASVTRTTLNETTVEIALTKEESGKNDVANSNGAVTEAIVEGPVTGPSSTILMPDDILVMNVTVKTNVSVGNIQGVTINPIRSMPPDVEAILNITHREKGEEYEYDYSEPTLPPSLPNVRIIPFVAADALVKEKDVPSTVTGYPSGSVVVPPELRPTDNSGFYDIATQENRFSPPIETEGGFVPREPPYFDTPYHSTDLNLEIGTGVTVVPAPITNPHRKNDADLASNCLFENREYRHADILPSNGICIICMCYYGEVVCSTEKCPPLKIGCRRIDSERECCGKIVCVDADESPTVVLDRADATAPSQRQPIVSLDPFRDVIKTEPAPDLPSLIEDMIPYLVEHGITTPRPTTSITTHDPNTKTSAQGQSSNQAQQRPQNSFEFVEAVPLIHPPFEYREENVDGLLTNSKDNRLPYKPEDVDQSLDGNVGGYESEVGPFDYNRVTLKRLNYSTTTTPRIFAADNNVTKLNVSKPNGFREQESERVTMGPSSLVNVNVSLVESSPSTVVTTTTSTTTTTTTSTTAITPITEDDPIFSFDSVFDLIFFSETTAKPNVEEPVKLLESNKNRTVIEEGVGSTSKKSSIELSTTEEAHEIESSSKVMDYETPVSSAAASPLKLAGCNIYGRMYRVGRIITELSSPCLECRCTEIGVQCKQLEC